MRSWDVDGKSCCIGWEREVLHHLDHTMIAASAPLLFTSSDYLHLRARQTRKSKEIDDQRERLCNIRGHEKVSILEADALTRHPGSRRAPFS